MHIVEGVLSPPVLLGGAAIAGVGTYIGLKKIEYENMPRVAVISSTFFVASLIHIPVGPTSVHLILNGLAGVILGWASYPALLLALFLQAVLFQFGGFTTLGVNTMTMATPALISFLCFKRFIRSKERKVSFLVGFLAGFMSIFLSGLFTALALFFSGEAFLPVAKLVVIVHIPVMIIEGILTGFVVLYLKMVKPDLLSFISYR